MNAAGLTELVIWTVYDHPLDYPDGYVARKWVLDKPSQDFVTAPTLEGIRHFLRQQGLARLPRHPNDDPVIVETWL